MGEEGVCVEWILEVCEVGRLIVVVHGSLNTWPIIDVDDHAMVRKWG